MRPRICPAIANSTASLPSMRSDDNQTTRHRSESAWRHGKVDHARAPETQMRGEFPANSGGTPTDRETATRTSPNPRSTCGGDLADDAPALGRHQPPAPRPRAGQHNARYAPSTSAKRCRRSPREFGRRERNSSRSWTETTLRWYPEAQQLAILFAIFAGYPHS